MTKRFQSVIKNVISLVILMFTFGIDSQSTISLGENELFVYKKTVNNTQAFIIKNHNNMISYIPNADECGLISNDGRYLFLSNRQPTTLRVMHLASQKVIYETVWLEDWIPCVFSWDWKHDDILNIVTQQEVQDFRFENLTLNPDVLYSEPNYPILPGFEPIFEPTGVEMLWVQNPAYPHIYFYEKCYAQVLLGQDCIGRGLVIYDLNTNTELEIIDTDPRYLRGFRIDSNQATRPVSSKLVSWSPNGRYLAYFEPLYGNNPLNIPDEGRIVIYDLQMDRYLPNDNDLYLPNIHRPLRWSSDNTLIMWRTGLLTEFDYYYYHDASTNLVFFNADTETGVYGDGVFHVSEGIGSYIASPNGQIFLFIGKQIVQDEPRPEGVNRGADLIMMSTITGEHTVIDTDVTEIITWRSVCDFTASDIPSLISTMQTEPYSVICLDENGQYDLTAPLPDVAGDITIIGNGSTITMTGQNRILNVVYNQQWSRNGSLTLKNVTLSGGNATEGGAIYNAGELTLDNVTLENHSAVRGGAIYNVGNLVMNGGAIQNNSASEFGGGIYNIGDMQLDGVNIRDNNAPEGSGVYQGDI